jgi:hypothetical protein
MHIADRFLPDKVRRVWAYLHKQHGFSNVCSKAEPHIPGRQVPACLIRCQGQRGTFTCALLGRHVPCSRAELQLCT